MRSKGLFPESSHCEGKSSERQREKSKGKPGNSHWHHPQAVDED